MVSNLPEEACWRATGRPMESTLSSEETASFQVLSAGQAYFRPSGIRSVYRAEKRRMEREREEKREGRRERKREQKRTRESK